MNKPKKIFKKLKITIYEAAGQLEGNWNFFFFLFFFFCLFSIQLIWILSLLLHLSFYIYIYTNLLIQYNIYTCQ